MLHTSGAVRPSVCLCSEQYERSIDGTRYRYEYIRELAVPYTYEFQGRLSTPPVPQRYVMPGTQYTPVPHGTPYPKHVLL